MKRISCILLSVFLLLTSMCTASASYTKETAAEELARYGSIDKNALGAFSVDGSVTRAGMVKLLVLTMGLAPAEGSLGFTDVPNDHFAHGYMVKATELGIINGMGDGTFAPEEFVTYAQAIKMVVCALGRRESAERQGGYPMGYAATAASLGISPEKAVLTDEADRGEIIIMLAKALDVPLAVMTDFGDHTAHVILDGKNGVEFRSWRTQLERIE